LALVEIAVMTRCILEREIAEKLGAVGRDGPPKLTAVNYLFEYEAGVVGGFLAAEMLKAIEARAWGAGVW
jgi:hypothetical protein